MSKRATIDWEMPHNIDAEMTVAELDALCQIANDELTADIEKFDERLAIQAEKLNDGKSTRQRALEALQRKERFRGEHNVARKWLQECEPPIRIFSRVTK